MTVSDGSPRPDSVALSAATLRVPTVFRPYTNGASVLTVPTGTLDDVMSDVFDRFPALFARLVVNGVVPKFIGIYVNGQEHRTIGGFAAPVEPGAEVAIIPAVSGGSDDGPSVALSAVEVLTKWCGRELGYAMDYRQRWARSMVADLRAAAGGDSLDTIHILPGPTATLTADLTVALEAAGWTGAALIAAERRRQVEAEGWTPEHDAEHTGHDLALAALCYLVEAHAPITTGVMPYPWPWDARYWKPSDDPIRNLVKAGALIAAEIDRLRAAAPITEGTPV